MVDEGWHYSDGVQQAGPVARAQLVSMLAAGIVQPTWLVWRAGMAEWAPASSVPELAFTPGQPPPLPAEPLGYRSPPPPSRSLGEDLGMRVLLPVGRSPWAIVAGYLGLFSVLLLPAPLAIVFGLVAIRDIRKHPEKHGMGRAIFALVMGFGCIAGFVAMIVFMR
jgi:GYF domain 2/Domain of unknown function (DUF4190)